MKIVFFVCMILTAAFAGAAEKRAAVPPQSASIQGEVLEVLDAKDFTYMRLRTKDGESWASVSKTEVKVGDKVTIENPMAMKDFRSKSLNRTFATLIMGNLAGAKPPSPHGAGMSNPHASGAAAVDMSGIKVPKATGANAQTVADVVTRRAEFKDKPVLVRGKVVKYNAGIMGRNWVHLRDGTGAEVDGSNDLLVTTRHIAKPGDVVTAKGVVRINKDFGAGYAYQVLIEDATLQK